METMFANWNAFEFLILCQILMIALIALIALIGHIFDRAREKRVNAQIDRKALRNAAEQIARDRRDQGRIKLAKLGYTLQQYHGQTNYTETEVIRAHNE